MKRLETLPPSEQVRQSMWRIDAFWTMAGAPGMEASEGLLDLPVFGGSIELRSPAKPHEPAVLTFKKFPHQNVSILRYQEDDEWSIIGAPSARTVRQAAKTAALLTMPDLATIEYLNDRMMRIGIMPSFEFTDMLLRKKFYAQQGERT